MTETNHIQNYLTELSNIGIGITFSGEVEQLEAHFLREYLENTPTAVVFDIGANVGGYTQCVKDIAPQSTIYAFEPHPTSYQQLKEKEKLGQVYTYNLAVGEREERSTLYDMDNAGTPLASLHREVIEKLHKREAISYDVQVRTVDALVKDLQLPRITLLKVDTEGNELAVFKGAQNSLDSGCIDAIQFEFNEMNVVSRTFFRDFYEILHDYKLFRLTKNGFCALTEYVPIFCEVFALQTIIGFRKELT